MKGPLSVVVIVAALALGVWCLIRAGLNRAPNRFDLFATAALSLLVAALVVVGVFDLFGTSRPSETTTFIGYLITAAVFAPGAFLLARLEPTRWGNVILGVACLVIPVLVLRLQQIAAVHGG